jgi:hypothetical protein
MTLGPLALLSVLGCPLVLGAALLRALGNGWRAEPLVAAALAWVAGCAGVAAVTLSCLVLALPLRAAVLVQVVLVLAGVLWALGSHRAGRGVPVARASPAREPGAAWLAVALAVVLVQLVARDLETSLVPVAWSGSDEGPNWALPALALFDAGALDAGYARRIAAFPAANPDYPLANPLLQVWTFAHAGHVLFVESRFLAQVASLTLFVLLAGVLRRHVRPWLAGALLLVVAQAGTAAEATASGGADGLAALGLLAGFACAERFAASGEARWLRAGAIALALLVGTKNEGLPYAVLLVAAFAPAARRHAPGRSLAWLLLPLAVAVLGALVDTHLGFRPYAQRGLTSDPLGRPLVAVGGYTVERVLATTRGALAWLFLRPGWHAGLFAAFTGACVLAPRAALGGELRATTVLLGGAMLLLAAVYPYYPLEIEWNLEASYARVHFHLLPVAAVWLAVALARLFPWAAPHADRSR